MHYTKYSFQTIFASPSWTESIGTLKTATACEFIPPLLIHPQVKLLLTSSNMQEIMWSQF